MDHMLSVAHADWHGLVRLIGEADMAIPLPVYTLIQLKAVALDGGGMVDNGNMYLNRQLCYAELCCAVLCCAVLCCAVLCCAVLCCAVLCCAVLWHATLPPCKACSNDSVSSQPVQ